MTVRGRASNQHTTWWRALAGLLSVVGVGCLLVGASPPDTVASPLASADATEIARVVPSPSPEGAPTAGVPRRLRIAVIGVSTPLSTLGLNADGTVEVPTRPEVAGWYHLGPRPGAAGSAVILGHVDSVAGPAVFARLDELHRGQELRVDSRDGKTRTFVVTSVATYANADFPAHRVYARAGGRYLNLVTCGGAYDAEDGGYQANVVVFTRWLHTH